MKNKENKKKFTMPPTLLFLLQLSLAYELRRRRCWSSHRCIDLTYLTLVWFFGYLLFSSSFRLQIFVLKKKFISAFYSSLSS